MRRLLLLVLLTGCLLCQAACSVVREGQLKSLAKESTQGVRDITWAEPTFDGLQHSVWLSNEKESISLEGTSKLPLKDVADRLQDRLQSMGWKFDHRLSELKPQESDCDCPRLPREIAAGRSSRVVPRGAKPDFALTSEELELIVSREDNEEVTKVTLTLKGFYMFDYPSRAVNGMCFAIAGLGQDEAGMIFIAFLLSSVLLPAQYLL